MKNIWLRIFQRRGEIWIHRYRNTKQTKKVNITFYHVVLKISEDTILLKGAIEETQIMHNKEQLLG